MADGTLIPPGTSQTFSFFGKGLEVKVPSLELKLNLDPEAAASSDQPGAEATPATSGSPDATQGLSANTYPRALTPPVLKVFPDLARENQLPFIKPCLKDDQPLLSEALFGLNTAVRALSPQLAELLPKNGQEAAFSSQAADALTAADLQQGLNYTVLQVLLSVQDQDNLPALELLKKGAQGTPPANESEKALLASFGFSFSGKGLVDDLNGGQPVSGELLSSLRSNSLGGRRLKALAQIMTELDPAAPKAFSPSKAQQDLLASFGLYAKAGKLLNLLNQNQPISAEAHAQLKQLIKQTDRQDFSLGNSGLQLPAFAGSALDGFGGGHRAVIGTRSMQASLDIELGLSSFAQSLQGKMADVDALRRKAEANREQIETVSTNLSRQDASNDATVTAIDKLIAVEQPRLAQRQSRLDQLSAWLNTLPKGADLDQALAKLGSEERKQIGEALELIGIKPEAGPNGQLRLPRGSAAQLGARVQTALDQAKTELAGLERQLQGLRDNLSSGMKKSAGYRQELEQLLRQQQTDLENLGEADKLMRAGRDELLRYRQDPARWNSLKPDEQALVERLLKDSEQSISATGQTLSLSREGLEQAQKIYAEAVKKAQQHGSGLSRAEKFQLFMTLCKQQIDQVGKLAMARMEQIPGGMSGAEILAVLLEQANALEARAQLAPKPIYKGLDEVADAWRELLSSGLREVKAQQSKANERDSFARGIDATRTAKLKESLDYHFKQLDQGRKLSGEQLKQWLEQSIQQFRQAQQA